MTLAQEKALKDKTSELETAIEKLRVDKEKELSDFKELHKQQTQKLTEDSGKALSD